jgi:branched-subunit amino acid aminotransferase/4-amino-4-deoxychorismate lyase
LRHFKSFAYLPKYLANREARQAGYDDAVLTNERDEICELSFSNLFVLPRGTDTWLTPPLDSGCLPGITRAALLASGLMSVREACLSEKDLRTCRAAIATNSLRGIMAISRIEGIELDVSVACRLLEELRALG